MSTRFADAAAADLRKVIAKAWEAAASIVDDQHEADGDALDAAMNQAVRMACALEEANAVVRAGMMVAIQDMGETSYPTKHHTITVAHRRPLILKGPVPPKYMKEVVDEKGIREDLKRKREGLDFVELGNGAPFLQIRKADRG